MCQGGASKVSHLSASRTNQRGIGRKSHTLAPSGATAPWLSLDQQSARKLHDASVGCSCPAAHMCIERFASLVVRWPLLTCRTCFCRPVSLTRHGGRVNVYRPPPLAAPFGCHWLSHNASLASKSLRQIPNSSGLSASALASLIGHRAYPLLSTLPSHGYSAGRSLVAVDSIHQSLRISAGFCARPGYLR